MAAGGFSHAGGTPANNIARWDGSSWSPMGSGVNNWVDALTWDNTPLFVGGRFNEAGNKSSSYVGRWDDVIASVPDDPAVAGALRLEPGFPNPFVSSTTIRYSLPEEGFVNLTIYDVRGRRVATLVDSFKPPGLHSATWDGRSRYGARVPQGVYFATIKSEGEVRAQKLVLAR